MSVGDKPAANCSAVLAASRQSCQRGGLAALPSKWLFMLLFELLLKWAGLVA
jgi:hypothetical protein